MKLDEIFIHVEGEGVPILLLHGWGLDHTWMKPIFDHYKHTHRVCMLDLPGFGNSVPFNESYSLNDYVECLKQIITLYKLDSPIIIAHSFGARIAFRYASIYPCRFLILTGAAGIMPKRNYKYYFKVYMYKVLKCLGIHVHAGSKDYQNANEYLKETLVKVVNEDQRQDIINICCPILLVWGEKDCETPLWMANTIKELNTNTTLIVLEKEDHFAYFHQIHRFLKICDAILKEGDTYVSSSL